MEHEISDFDRWLHRVEAHTRGLELAPALDTVARLAAEEFDVHLWFVEAFGRRLSYIAGEIVEQPAPRTVCRIPLDEHISLVSDTVEKLPSGSRSEFINLLKHMVSSRRPQ